MLGGAATVLSPEVVFSAVSLLAVGLAAWAWSMPGVEPEDSPGVRAMLRTLRRPAVMAGFWLFTIPALFAGVIEVLVPLRMDDLGASGAAIGAVFLVSAAVEATISPVAGRWSDRAGRLAPIRAGLIGAAVMAVLLPLPGSAVLLGLTVVIAIACLAVFWAPGMAMLSDAAEDAGLDQALAFSLSNLAWAVGHIVGAGSGGAIAEATADAVPYAALAVACVATLARADREPAAAGRRCAARRLAAVRPGRAAALAVQLQCEPILQPLGRVGRVAATADGAPGRPAELVLAAVLPTRRDGARVAPRLALGDPLEGGWHVHAARARAAHGAAAERPEAEGAARQRSDDAVRHEVAPALETLHGALGLRPEDAVGVTPSSAGCSAQPSRGRRA